MKIVKIIESKRWVNKKNGRTASIYGAAPYMNNAEKLEWVIETVGYTWQLNNGTIGLGRIPAKTFEEAQQVMDFFNKNNN